MIKIPIPFERGPKFQRPTAFQGCGATTRKGHRGLANHLLYNAFSFIIDEIFLAPALEGFRDGTLARICLASWNDSVRIGRRDEEKDEEGISNTSFRDNNWCNTCHRL